MTFVSSPVLVRSLANVAEYPAGAMFGPRQMSSFEFVWVLRGSATWHIEMGEDAQAHPLTPGTIALSPLGAAERYEWDATQASSHAFVHFELPADVDASEWPRTRRMAQLPLLAALCDSLLSPAAGTDQTMRARSSHIVGLMLDVFLEHEDEGDTGDHALEALAERAVSYVKGTWSATGMRIIAIVEIARALDVSPGYLSRSFRSHFGIGPARAFEMVRLARAAVALQRTSSTVAAIAAECGFSDEFHLSKRFSSRYGSPPGAFRRDHGEDEPLAPLVEHRLMSLWRSLTDLT
ncbi:helix-turn-helix protein [Microbacterium sp. BK668]|nr:helix-turn-helix protein [Microbacterium sp. BK668]